MEGESQEQADAQSAQRTHAGWQESLIRKNTARLLGATATFLTRNQTPQSDLKVLLKIERGYDNIRLANCKIRNGKRCRESAFDLNINMNPNPTRKDCASSRIILVLKSQDFESWLFDLKIRFTFDDDSVMTNFFTERQLAPGDIANAYDCYPSDR